MEIRHHLFGSFVIVALLFFGATGSCFAQCSIIADAATESHDGIVHIPPNGTAAFSLSTTNTGQSCNITVTSFSIEIISGSIITLNDINSTLCQTNPQNASCFNPALPAATVNLPFSAGEQPTFSVFLQASGEVPPQSKVCVRFTDQTGEGSLLCVPLTSS
jgi:hypothetical protein